MPNTETVRALVSAFNVHNYARDTVKTNFTLQSRGGEDCIVVSFDKGMKDYQCSEYLYNIKRKIVGEFYGIEERDTDEVVLNTAKLIFDVKSFPFNIYKGFWSVGKHGGFEFAAPVDQGVIFNLKSHLASSLKKDVLEDMRVSSATIAFKEKKYLWHDEFDNKELCKQFEHEFLSRMRKRYDNVPNDPLKVKGNGVYIKDVFNDARFIDSVTRHVAWLIGRDLQADSKSRSDVRAFKDLIMEILDPSTHVVINAFFCASPLNREEASILIPVILSDRGARFLTAKEAGDINHKFSNLVLDNINSKTQATFKVNGSSAIYGIDFSNPEISHCVVTKIIESSVINAKHELAIDPELRLRASSPTQSPFNSPTHAGPSGLRTPSNPRERSRDSGYGSNSPPKPNGSVAHSSSDDPSSDLTELSSLTQEFPTRDQNVAKDSPRQGSEKKQVLHDLVNLAGTSKGFSPSSRLNSTAVNCGVPGPSSSVQSVGAVQNVPILWTGGSSQPMSRCSLPASSAGLSSVPQSRPSSWEAVGKSRSAWTSQPIVPWSSPGLCAQSNDIVPWLQPSTRMSSTAVNRVMIEPKKCVGATQNVPTWTGANSSSSQGTSGNRWTPSMQFTQPGPIDLSRKQSGPSSWRGANERGTSDKSLTEEEKNLFEKLLYAFNLNNYILECPNTNFIVKNGKIASLINDGVDREKYLQAVRDYTIEEYYVTEKEACDLNEFPFKFLSNCEKNQETTVVANMSCGALLNLKKLFIQGQGHKEEVEIEDIDINIVKKAVKSKKDIWVDSQVQELGVRPDAALKTCYPDESELKHIPIIKDKGGYCLDRTYSTKEVKSFVKERRCAKGISVAGKVNPEDNRDSGISSGEATDAENVSSKAEATTSGYESMDCENTRGGLPKRTPELSMGIEKLAISTDLDATKVEQHSPIKKFRSN